MAEDGILTLGEVADYLKLTERTLYRLTQENRRPGFKWELVAHPAAGHRGLA